jgi:hypothetical protein
MVDRQPSCPNIVLDVFASADKLRTPPFDAPPEVQIFAGLCCKSPMNFTWLHPLSMEKANDDSLLIAVEHFENSNGKEFSLKKGVVLRHGA